MAGNKVNSENEVAETLDHAEEVEEMPRASTPKSSRPRSAFRPVEEPADGGSGSAADESVPPATPTTPAVKSAVLRTPYLPRLPRRGPTGKS